MTNVYTNELQPVTRTEVQQWFIDAGFTLVRQTSKNLYKWVSFPNGTAYMRVCFGVHAMKIERRSQNRNSAGRFEWVYWAASSYRAVKKSGPRLLVGAAWLDSKTFK